MAGRGPESDADADLVRPPTDAVGGDAVQPHRGQPQADHAERPREHSGEALRNQGQSDHSVHRNDTEDGKGRVELVDDVADHGVQACWLNARADVERDRVVQIGLFEGAVKVEPWALAESSVLGIGGNTDDLQLRALAIGSREPKTASDRLTRGPESFRHCLIDDRDLRRCRRVGGREVAPGPDRNAKSVEVLRRGHHRVGDKTPASPRRVESLDADQGGLVGEGERDHVRQGGALDAGDGGHAFLKDTVEAPRRGRVVALNGEVEPDQLHAARIEPRIESCSAKQRSDQESGDHHQDERQGDLADDQAASQARAMAAGPGVFVLECCRQIDRGGVKPRNHPRHEPGDQCDEQGKSENPRVDSEIEVDRHRQRELDGEQGARRKGCDPYPDGAADGEENQGLGDERLEHPGTARSDRDPNRDLAPATERPREEHVGDVDAGDHQNQSDDRCQDRHEGLDVAAYLAGDRRRLSHVETAVLLHLGKGGRHLGGDALEHRVGLAQLDAGSQAAEELEAEGSPVVEDRSAGIDLLQHHHRRVGVVANRGSGASELRRSDADHGVGTAVDEQLCAQDPLVLTVLAGPGAVIEDDHGVGADRFGFFGEKEPSSVWIDAENMEEIVGHDVDHDRGAVEPRSQGAGGRVLGSQTAQHLGAAFPIGEEVFVGEAVEPGAVFPHRVDAHESIGIIGRKGS